MVIGSLEKDIIVNEACHILVMFSDFRTINLGRPSKVYTPFAVWTNVHGNVPRTIWAHRDRSITILLPASFQIPPCDHEHLLGFYHIRRRSYILHILDHSFCQNETQAYSFHGHDSWVYIFLWGPFDVLRQPSDIFVDRQTWHRKYSDMGCVCNPVACARGSLARNVS
jgi:hypothetical protein